MAWQFQLNKPLVRYKVGRNYCIRIRGHSYSVHYRYVGLHVLARVEKGNMLRIYDANSLELLAEHHYWGEQRDVPEFTHIKDEHRARKNSVSTLLNTSSMICFNSFGCLQRDYL